MSPESFALLGLGLGVLALLGVALARRTRLPDPVLLVVLGLLASLVPGAPVVDLPPDVVFLVFLPPLLYRASFETSPRTLRSNAVPVALLAVGLVLATAFTVAALLWAVVPDLPFAAALVLGAVVAPTDPVAASAVFGRLGAPRRIVDILQGESLVNDASALVLYAIAVEAVVSGPPSVLDALGRLVLAVPGGVLVGLLLAEAVTVVRRRVPDVGLQLLLSLLTPYAAYVLAGRVGASGVLAVVTTGLVLGSRSSGVFGPQVRVQGQAFWSLLDLVLNAVLFVLLGLEVRRLLAGAPDLGVARTALYAALVVASVVVLRVLWQLLVPPPVYALRRRLGRPPQDAPVRERLLLGWTGMRGAISLAAALAIPVEAGGEPFPDRPLLLFLTVCVILATLVVQGTSLPFVLRRLGLSGTGDGGRSEQQTRVALADVALGRLDEMSSREGVPGSAVEPLRRLWEQTRARAAEDDGLDDDEVDLAPVRLELSRLQSQELARRERAGLVLPEVARTLRAELDLQQVRLTRPGDE